MFDVAVDLRRSSPNFGRWAGVELSAENRRQFWIPPGFGHGFVVLSEATDFLYKATGYWDRDDERCILWRDPTLNIAWPVRGTPIVSAKDGAAVTLDAADVFP